LAYSVGFGLLGSTAQWYLPGTNPSMLPVPSGVNSPPVEGAISEVMFSPEMPALLFGGLVAASGQLDRGAGLLLDVTGAWNSVKNVNLTSDSAGIVTLSGFVHTDVTLGDGGDSSITVIGAKRGNIVTGNGDDLAFVRLASNEFGWVNEFRIATNEGNDNIVVDALDLAEQAVTDITFASTTHGAGSFRANDSDSVVFAALGDGDDRFFALGASRDRISGDAGRDVILGGRGDDILAGGADADIFIFRGDDGTDIITDFTPGEDRLLLVEFSGADLQAVLDRATDFGGSVYLSHTGGTIVLVGVATTDLSRSDLF
jgi:Ca2+-binding RTX toxin-like protein